jgi:histidine triad (HIT) family protein
MSTEDCLFCKIANGTVPATIVYESELTVAFRDVTPQAPVHILVIPRSHHPSFAALAAADPDAAVDLVRAVAAVAAKDCVAESGYRLVFNTGPDAHQTVFHAHGHVLAGRTMGWPPG